MSDQHRRASAAAPAAAAPSAMSSSAPPSTSRLGERGAERPPPSSCASAAARPGPERDQAGGDPEQRERRDRQRLEQIEPREPAVLHARPAAAARMSVEALRLDAGRRASTAPDRRSRRRASCAQRGRARGAAPAEPAQRIGDAAIARAEPAPARDTTGRGGNPSQPRNAATISPSVCTCGCASSQRHLRRRARRAGSSATVSVTSSMLTTCIRRVGRAPASPRQRRQAPRSIAVPP